MIMSKMIKKFPLLYSDSGHYIYYVKNVSETDSGEMLRTFSEKSICETCIDKSKIQKLRDELYNDLPTGEVHAFELIQLINRNIRKLDKILRDDTNA